MKAKHEVKPGTRRAPEHCAAQQRSEIMADMVDKGDVVDFDGLELIDMRLEIDVDTLVTYMEENSEFPGMTS